MLLARRNRLLPGMRTMKVGNQTNQVDALNRTNKFEYDAMGRRTRQTLPGLQSAAFGYDVAGNQTRITNFNSVVITNQYDALNRLTNKASAGGYTIGFELFPTGQRATMYDASGTTVYTYDGCNRLLTKATPQGRLTYTYDSMWATCSGCDDQQQRNPGQILL